jgi:aminoglycoside phosphotransferase (APT) family kinase protein
VRDELTTNRVTNLLRERVDSSAVCNEVERGPVGNGQETWFVEATTGTRHLSLVIRRSAPGGPLRWTRREDEYEMQAAVFRAGLPVPEVHWMEEEPSSLDRPYFVMDRVPGVAGTHPSLDPAAMAAELGVLLARLHDANVAVEALDPAATSREATLGEIERWRTIYFDTRPAPEPALTGLFAWLKANVPESLRPVTLLWGDPGPHNILVEDGHATAMLDWELGHIGDPLEDLGTALWFFEDRVDPSVLIGSYEGESGTAVDVRDLDFFVALASATRAAMVLSGARSFAAGETSYPPTAALAMDLLIANLERAATIAGWDPLPDFGPLSSSGRRALLRPTPAQVDEGVGRFLETDVLPAVSDRRVRRGLKTAVALLKSNAIRIENEHDIGEQLEAGVRGVLDAAARQSLPDDLDELAAHVESGEGSDELRKLVRAHLLVDLAQRKRLIDPLRAMYGRS